MIPYHHYPRVGLQYCRCDNCGNDLRSMLLSRLFDKRRKNIPYTPTPRYKLKRRRPLMSRKISQYVRGRVNPPYKQRRAQRLTMQKLLKEFGVE